MTRPDATAGGTNRYDVAVLGAGPAGIAAALAAAGAGASVLVVERGARTGGNVSQAFVHTICGLYLASPAHEAVFAHPGLPRTFAELLVARGAAGAVDWAGSAGFLAIDPEAFGSIAEELFSRTASIDVRTGSSVTRLMLAATPAAACTVEYTTGAPDTRSHVAQAHTVVDTTGDATAAALAGVRTEQAQPEALQHPSFIFRVDGVDTDLLDAMERARTTAAVARASRSGALPASASSVVLRPALAAGSVWITLNRPKPDGVAYDPLDAGVLERLERSARNDAGEVLGYLTAERAPFRRACAGSWPVRTGIRETRRVAGICRLEVEDVVEGRRRDDEACVTTWPVEIWSSAERMTFRHTAGPASIPLGCLVADHPSRRLAMAGRCASASHDALGAIRVVGTAMAMGEAAGVACALAASSRSDLSAIDPAAVRGVVASGRIAAPCRAVEWTVP